MTHILFLDTQNASSVKQRETRRDTNDVHESQQSVVNEPQTASQDWYSQPDSDSASK